MNTNNNLNEMYTSPFYKMNDEKKMRPDLGIELTDAEYEQIMQKMGINTQNNKSLVLGENLSQPKQQYGMWDFNQTGNPALDNNEMSAGNLKKQELYNTPITSEESLTPDAVLPTQTPPTFMQTLLSNPLLNSGAGVNLNSKLFAVGQSVGGNDFSYLNNTELEGKAKNANLLRGIAAGGASLLDIGRTVAQGAGFENKRQEILNEYYRKQREKNYNYMESGGVISLPFEKQASGEYVAGLPKSMEYMTNAELEDGEFLQNLDSTVQKVIGNTHEQGGEKLLLDAGTKVVSDHKTLGDQAKICAEKYDVKLKSSDTYAEAIDKYSKKIGLTEKQEELENLYKQVKAQDDITDAETKKINLAFLASEIEEEKEEMADLLKQRETFTSYIFNKQEKSKQEDMEQDKDDDVKIFRDGGMLSALCKKYGISEEEGMSILNENNPQAFDGGGKVGLYKGAVNGSSLAPEELPTIVNYLNTKAVTQGTPTFDATTYKTEKEANVAFQTWIYTNFPEYKAVIDKSHAAPEKGGLGQPTAGVYNEGNIGKRYDPVFEAIKKDAASTSTAAPAKVTGTGKEVVDATAGITPLDIKNQRKLPAHLMLPAQFNLAPESLVAQLNLNPNRERLSPVEMSPEATLVEINKAQNFANSQVNMNPFGSNAALLSNIQSNTSESINKAILATNSANQQNEYNTDITNLNQSNMERQLQEKADLDYEERAQTGLAKTLADYYNWFSANQANAVAQYSYLNKFQTAQGLFENVTLDANGNPIFDKTQNRQLYYPPTVTG